MKTALFLSLVLVACSPPCPEHTHPYDSSTDECETDPCWVVADGGRVTYDPSVYGYLAHCPGEGERVAKP